MNAHRCLEDVRPDENTCLRRLREYYNQHNEAGKAEIRNIMNFHEGCPEVALIGIPKRHMLWAASIPCRWRSGNKPSSRWTVEQFKVWLVDNPLNCKMCNDGLKRLFEAKQPTKAGARTADESETSTNAIERGNFRLPASAGRPSKKRKTTSSGTTQQGSAGERDDSSEYTDATTKCGDDGSSTSKSPPLDRSPSGHCAAMPDHLSGLYNRGGEGSDSNQWNALSNEELMAKVKRRLEGEGKTWKRFFLDALDKGLPRPGMDLRSLLLECVGQGSGNQWDTATNETILTQVNNSLHAQGKTLEDITREALEKGLPAKGSLRSLLQDWINLHVDPLDSLTLFENWT